jgi:hypothetical protein
MGLMAAVARRGTGMASVLNVGKLGVVLLNRFLCIGLLLCVPTIAMADAADSESHCYDAIVVARPVEQIPSEIPDCGDCIVMEWPWFLDLQVKRVVAGHVEGKLIRVLAVQHSWLIPRYRKWRLRKNSLGSFNVVLSWPAPPPLCSAAVASATPYIQPKEGETLDDLRNAGERRYGRTPWGMHQR